MNNYNKKKRWGRKSLFVLVCFGFFITSAFFLDIIIVITAVIIVTNFSSPASNLLLLMVLIFFYQLIKDIIKDIPDIKKTVEEKIERRRILRQKQKLRI